MGFSKVHPACHNIVNGTKPGSDSKKTDKHAVGCSKTYLAALSDLSEMYKKIYIVQTTMWPKVSVYLIKNMFCLYRKNFMHVRAFERYIPIKVCFSTIHFIRLLSRYFKPECVACE